MRHLFLALTMLFNSVVALAEPPCPDDKKKSQLEMFNARYSDYFSPPQNEHTAFKCLNPGRLSCEDKITLLTLKRVQEIISEKGKTPELKEKQEMLMKQLSPKAQMALYAGSVSEALARANRLDKKMQQSAAGATQSNPSPKKPAIDVKDPARISALLGDLESKTKFQFNRYRQYAKQCSETFLRYARKRSSSTWGKIEGGLTSAYNYYTGLDQLGVGITSDQKLIEDCEKKIDQAEYKLSDTYFEWIEEKKKANEISPEEIKLLTNGFRTMTQETNAMVTRTRIAFSQGVADGSVSYLKGAMAVGATILTAGAAAEALGVGTIGTGTATATTTTTAATATNMYSATAIAVAQSTKAALGVAAANCVTAIGADRWIEAGSEVIKRKIKRGTTLTCEEMHKLMANSQKSPLKGLNEFAASTTFACGSGIVMGAGFSALFKGGSIVAAKYLPQELVERYVLRAGLAASSLMIGKSGGDAVINLNHALEKLSEVADYNSDPEMNACIEYASQVAVIDSTSSFAYDVVEILAGHYFAKPRVKLKPSTGPPKTPKDVPPSSGKTPAVADKKPTQEQEAEASVTLTSSETIPSAVPSRKRKPSSDDSPPKDKSPSRAQVDLVQVSPKSKDTPTASPAHRTPKVKVSKTSTVYPNGKAKARINPTSSLSRVKDLCPSGPCLGGDEVHFSRVQDKVDEQVFYSLFGRTNKPTAGSELAPSPYVASAIDPVSGIYSVKENTNPVGKQKSFMDKQRKAQKKRQSTYLGKTQEDLSANRDRYMDETGTKDEFEGGISKASYREEGVRNGGIGTHAEVEAANSVLRFKDDIGNCAHLGKCSELSACLPNNCTMTDWKKVGKKYGVQFPDQFMQKCGNEPKKCFPQPPSEGHKPKDLFFDIRGADFETATVHKSMASGNGRFDQNKVPGPKLNKALDDVELKVNKANKHKDLTPKQKTADREKARRTEIERFMSTNNVGPTKKIYDQIVDQCKGKRPGCDVAYVRAVSFLCQKKPERCGAESTLSADEGRAFLTSYMTTGKGPVAGEKPQFGAGHRCFNCWHILGRGDFNSTLETGVSLPTSDGE